MPAEMAQQEEGWPLGLQPLNARARLRSISLSRSGSVLSSTSVTCSPAFSTDYSSDLDIESTGFFSPEKKTTLGSLIGAASILELSRRSIKGRNLKVSKHRKSDKTKPWCFSICSKDGIDVKTSKNAPSLGHFLAVERRVTNDHTRHGRSSDLYGPDDYAFPDDAVVKQNSLFVNGRIAPHRTSRCCQSDTDRRGDASSIQDLG